MGFRLFALLLLLLPLSSCKKREQAERYLHIGFRHSVRCLDPTVGIDYPTSHVMKMLFEGLMYIGPDGELTNAIADSYSVSRDHKTYTFTLRPAKWSNGDPVTAHDFEYSWKKVIDPTKETIGAHNFYPIKGARQAALGKIPLDEVGITALDARTLEVKLEHPTPYFTEMLVTTSFLPINARVDKEDQGWSNREGDAFVCNGPYCLERHHLEHEIVVKKNPNYWNKEEVTMPGIQISVIKDSMTQLSLYEKKELDWVGKPFSAIPFEALQEMKKRGDVQFYKTLGLYWYFINVEAFPFQNTKMRKAFSYAVDRKLLTDHLLEGKEKPAMGVLPYTLATQATPFFEDNNQELALKLFDEALVELGTTRKQLGPITIHFSADRSHLLVAEALQEQWNKVFGLDVKLEHQDWKAHFAKLRSGDYQIGGMGWYSWIRDPIYIMQTFRDKEGDGYNMTRWVNKEYQALLAATENELDARKRAVLFNKAESLLMEEMPVIPLFFQTIAYAKNPNLKNVYISELYDVDFRWSYFDFQN